MEAAPGLAAVGVPTGDPVVESPTGAGSGPNEAGTGGAVFGPAADVAGTEPSRNGLGDRAEPEALGGVDESAIFAYKGICRGDMSKLL